jgi:hypothetical protein
LPKIIVRDRAVTSAHAADNVIMNIVISVNPWIWVPLPRTMGRDYYAFIFSSGVPNSINLKTPHDPSVKADHCLPH